MPDDETPLDRHRREKKGRPRPKTPWAELTPKVPKPVPIPPPADPGPIDRADVPQELMDAYGPGVRPNTAALPPSPRQVEYIRSLILEAERRSIEALKLYEPLPSQAAFHMSRSRQRIVRGSNRAGKTLSTHAELAFAVTGQHPDPDKYPKENGRAIVVARDQEKIGEVCWRKLGRAGAFLMVRDPATGRWRARRPGDESLKTKPVPPLIPPRLIESISWEKKAAGIPKKVILKNGWEINFFSSKSDPDTIQGMDVDIVVFDEEIIHHEWYPEAIARLIDRIGWFWWGATPQAGTPQLFDLHVRAQSLAEEPDERDRAGPPLVAEYFLSIWDNVHLDQQSKDDFVASVDDEERRVRVDGEFAISGLRIYEAYFFPRGVHAADPFPIPATWTRYCAIDPGAQVGAVLFAAVPPSRPEPDSGVDPALYGDFVYFYDEIYIRGCDAKKLAVSMKQHIGDQHITTMLIDHHGGMLREIGSGRTPEQQYKDSFRAEKVVPKDWVGFTWAADDVPAGILRVKDWLRVREDGTSKIRILKGTCPNLLSEVVRYQWKVTAGIVTDKPLAKNNHLVDDLRYLCLYPGLRYRKPKPRKVEPRGAYDAFKAFLGREKARKGADSGAGITLA